MIWNCSKQMKDGSACQPKGWRTVVEPSNDNVRSTSHEDGSACQPKGWRTVAEPSNAKVVIYFEIAKRFYENSYELFLKWYVKWLLTLTSHNIFSPRYYLVTRAEILLYE
jgi:hypothetical protein